MRRALSGLFIAGCFAVVSSWAAWGCLPDPPIRLPDLSVAGSPADGGDGGLARLDGPRSDLGTAGWQAESGLGTMQTLRAAWVADASAREVFVVGHAGVILHLSGGSWQKESSGTDANLYAVAARTPTEVFAVGDRGVILRRVSGTWQREGSELASTSPLFGLSVLPSGEVIAVGDNGLIARRQTAGVWVAETAPALAGLALRSVAGPRLDALFAVGMNSAIVRRGQLGWELDPLPIDGAGRGNYYAVATNPADSAPVAVGEYGLILSRRADRWQVEKRMPPSGMTAPLHLYGLSVAGDELFVVGAGGYVARRLASGGSWTEEASGTRADLFSVSGSSVSGLVSVGENGTLVRRQ
ncbi:MAG: hypothetical protein JNJ46_27245 [Myxococcales bacterium]|nr:hypothetical protein [Myxococcales bacterium]